MSTNRSTIPGWVPPSHSKISTNNKGMSHEKRLGWAAIALGLLGAGALYLWPNARWIGWTVFGGGVVSGLIWAYLEIRPFVGDERILRRFLAFGFLTISLFVIIGLNWPKISAPIVSKPSVTSPSEPSPPIEEKSHGTTDNVIPKIEHPKPAKAHDAVKELAEELRKELARPPEKKPCRLENGQLVDCTEAEVLDWGKPLMKRLGEAIEKNEKAMWERHREYQRTQNKAILKQNLIEHIELNRYLERDYKNFVIYRGALLGKLQGGDPTNYDPIQSLAIPPRGYLAGGHLGLSDKYSMLSDAQAILRDFQDLGNLLAQQMPEESKNDNRPYSSKSLSQMTPTELLFRTQAFCAKLRILGDELDAKTDADNQRWVTCDHSANSKEEKTFCSSKRQADHEHSLSLMKDKFDKHYFQGAQALKTVLLNRVGGTRIGGGRIIGPGSSEPALPPTPPLLESGSLAGANPFKSVAEYLENLAARL